MNIFKQQIENLKFKFYCLNGPEQDEAIECLKLALDEFQESREGNLRETILQEAEKEVAIAAERLIMDRLSGNYEPIFEPNNKYENDLDFSYATLASIHRQDSQDEIACCSYIDNGTGDEDPTDSDDFLTFQFQSNVCGECGFAANNRKALYRHGVKEKHKTRLPQHNGGTHVCSLCDFSSSRKFNLDRHMQRVHFPLRNNPCPLCSLNFKDRDTLRQHLKRIHGDTSAIPEHVS